MGIELDKMKITEKWDITDDTLDAKWTTCPERDVLWELWRNRPWKYLSRVWRALRHFPRSKAVSRLTWLRYCLMISWRPAYKNGGRGRYTNCKKCLCYTCTDAKCAKRHCVSCGSCTTFICGRRGMVKDEEATV